MDKKSPPLPLQNSTSDSGFCSSNTIHTLSLDFTPITTFQSTPYDPQNSVSRKRKISQIITTPTTHLGNIASSTLNESAIAQSFEKCNISSFTPNYYTQRPEYFDESPKKKQHSEPSTPAKGQITEEEETEFFRLHNNSFHKTPTKYCYQRLGSPECNKILYGGELKTNSITKGNSLRYDVKRHSPAKKRLFKINEFEAKRRPVTINPHRKFDPVKYFVTERNIECVFERIFPCLSDEDLYNFMRVSKEWRNLILSNGKTTARLGMFMEEARRNKENSFEKSSELKKKSVTLLSAENRQDENKSPCFRSTYDLREGQRYSICPKCSKNSVVECNIGQCIQQNCGYIYCLNCSSCSSTGPENFQDRCMQSKLLIPTEPNKLRLTLSPKREPLSFLMNSPTPKLYAPCFSDVSDSEISPHMRQSERRRSSILGDCNRDVSLEEEKIFTPRTLPVVKVVSVVRKRIEIMEPSSPPKIKNVACSTKSKKYLKRLIRN